MPEEIKAVKWSSPCQMLGFYGDLARCWWSIFLINMRAACFAGPIGWYILHFSSTELLCLVM